MNGKIRGTSAPKQTGAETMLIVRLCIVYHVPGSGACFVIQYSAIIIIIIIIIHNLYSAALLKDPAALYNNGNVNIKSVR